MARGGEPLWTDVRIELEILEPGIDTPRIVLLSQPFAVIGRLADSHIRIQNRAVSELHAYLHADARGLFFVDLATRTGIRFDGNLALFGWLRPGEMIEIAGCFIRVNSFEISGRPASPPPCSANLFADTPAVALCGLSLEPLGQRGVSWTLGSELVFLGRGDSCGIRLNQANVARTHCALYRTPSRTYLISLPGHPTQVDGEIVRVATALNDGSVISIGQTRFTVHVAPPSPNINTPNATGREVERVIPAALRNLPAFNGLAELASSSTDGQPFPLELIPPESRDAVLGWMLGTLHDGQNEIIRRQNELQHSIALILQHMQTDTNSRLDDQSNKLEALTEELTRINAKQSTPSPTTQPATLIPPPPPIEPRRRPTHDLPPAPEIDPARSLETAAWLLGQMDNVGNDNKFSLKSLLTRRTSKKENPLPEDDSSIQSDKDLKTNRDQE